MVNIAVRAARQAGGIALRHLNQLEALEVVEKGRNEFVSKVDQLAEEAIIEVIREYYPEHSILAEEGGQRGNHEYQWIIDPLDGTTNYLHGFPTFSVSIAVTHNGQLEHGVNYATAYLANIGKETRTPRPLKKWPYKKGSRVRLFVLAGHRNMEGERAFIQELKTLKGKGQLLQDDSHIAFKYSLGGGYKTSNSWEPLGPAGYYDTFGPELSFGRTLSTRLPGNIAIAKFTHSGTQINDWTPEGSVAKSRNIYPRFVAFVKQAVKEITDRGNQVELVGIFYHLGENDMSMGQYRRKAPEWIRSTVNQSRKDLDAPDLKWFVSQQPPTDDKRVNNIDVVTEIEKVAAADSNFVHIKAFDLPAQEKKLVISTEGIVELGEVIARHYLEQRKP